MKRIKERPEEMARGRARPRPKVRNARSRTTLAVCSVDGEGDIAWNIPVVPARAAVVAMQPRQIVLVEQRSVEATCLGTNKPAVRFEFVRRMATEVARLFACVRHAIA